mgnify:CR=1 FL=1
MSDENTEREIATLLMCAWTEYVALYGESPHGTFTQLHSLLALQSAGRNIIALCARRAEVAAWRSIETAPHDDEPVLLLVPTLYGKWNKSIQVTGRWEDRPNGGGFWTIFNADEAIQRVEATHWMPRLPSPSMNLGEGRK